MIEITTHDMKVETRHGDTRLLIYTELYSCKANTIFLSFFSKEVDILGPKIVILII